MITYCSRCIVPSSRPEQTFTDGVCDACLSAEDKHSELIGRSGAMSLT